MTGGQDRHKMYVGGGQVDSTRTRILEGIGTGIRAASKQKPAAGPTGTVGQTAHENRVRKAHDGRTQAVLRLLPRCAGDTVPSHSIHGYAIHDRD